MSLTESTKLDWRGFRLIRYFLLAEARGFDDAIAFGERRRGALFGRTVLRAG
jgi:hypothetical protein